MLRGAGRTALWLLVGMLLVRGVLATAAGPPAEAPAHSTPDGVGQAEASFAIRFARAYLADPRPASLAGYLAGGAQGGFGRSPRRGQEVAQAEAVATEELGGGREVLTVACELRDSRTLYLAVPIVRSKAGEVAALGAPSMVAAPTVAGADPERPQPLAGSDTGAIQALVEKFVPGYLEASEPSDLAYFVAPGATVRPLGGDLDFGAVTGVTQLGSGEGPRREVLVAARLTDRASGTAYPVVYRLELIRGARWYVEAVEGALS